MWKAGGNRAATAKRTPNRVVHQIKIEAEKVALQKIDARSGDVYRLAKQMRRDNQDVMGEKPVKNDAGQLSLDEESKKEAKSRLLENCQFIFHIFFSDSSSKNKQFEGAKVFGNENQSTDIYTPPPPYTLHFSCNYRDDFFFKMCVNCKCR